jgi:hypothetical protein
MIDNPTILEPKPTGPLDVIRLRETLETVLGRMASALDQSGYCLIGTAAALLQGVPLFAGDVDFLMKRRADVDAFAGALSDFPALTPPTWLEAARQYYAAYSVNGIKVETSTVEWDTDSEYRETVGSGPWTYQNHITVGPYHVPTVVLELRLATELQRNRPDRYEPIITWMSQNGSNTDLLVCAIDAHGLPPEQQHHVLAQIAPGTL